MTSAVRGIALTLVVVAVLVATTSCSPPAGDQTVNGRTLLTYNSSGTSANAALSGTLHANAAGCIVVGDSVLVVPSGSELKSDGTIVILGHTYKLGSAVRLGGGGGDAPRASACGKHVTFWYV